MSRCSSIRIVIVFVFGIVYQIGGMLLNDVLVMPSSSILFKNCFSIAGSRVDYYFFHHLARFVIGIDDLRFPTVKHVSSRRTSNQLSIGVFVIERMPIVRMMFTSSIIEWTWCSPISKQSERVFVFFSVVDESFSVPSSSYRNGLLEGKGMVYLRCLKRNTYLYWIDDSWPSIIIVNIIVGQVSGMMISVGSNSGIPSWTLRP